MKKIYLHIITSTLPLMLFASRAHAQTTGDRATFENPLQANTLQEFLLNIIDILLTFAIPFAVLAIMYGGFLLATSGANPKNLDKGKSVLTWSIVGAVIIFGAKQILDIFIQTVQSI